MPDHETHADHIFSPVKGGDRWIAWCYCGWESEPRSDVFAALRDRYDHLITVGVYLP